MPYLGNAPAEAYSNIAYQDFGTQSGTTFTLDYPAGAPGELEVFVNNVRQEPSVAYTVSGTTLTMTGTIASTDDFYVVFQGKSQQTVRHPANTALEATSGTFSGALSMGSISGGIPNLVRVQTFTADGTYTKSSGATKALVYVVGGGGGGGGVDGQGSGNTGVGGGGGAGGMAIKLITSGLGDTETVTIGSGGGGVLVAAVLLDQRVVLLHLALIVQPLGVLAAAVKQLRYLQIQTYALAVTVVLAQMETQTQKANRANRVLLAAHPLVRALAVLVVCRCLVGALKANKAIKVVKIAMTSHKQGAAAVERVIQTLLATIVAVTAQMASLLFMNIYRN